MNKRKATLLAAAVLIAAVVAGSWLFFRSPKTLPDEADAPAAAAAVPAPAPPDQTLEAFRPRGPVTDTRAGRKPYSIGVTVDKRVTHTDDGKHIFNEAIEIARELHDPETSGEEDVTQFNEILSFYRMVFDENPVAGDNQSVMAALMGDNPRGIVVFPTDHPSLNAQGELVDRWGTPYYFHALTEKQMEVVSPGPDKVIGTTDDVIYTERDSNDFFRGVTSDTGDTGDTDSPNDP